MVNIVTNIYCARCDDYYQYRDWENDIAACPRCSMVELEP